MKYFEKTLGWCVVLAADLQRLVCIVPFVAAFVEWYKPFFVRVMGSEIPKSFSMFPTWLLVLMLFSAMTLLMVELLGAFIKRYYIYVIHS